MTNQEKVTQLYPEAWYRVSGPHSAMIWSSSADDRKVLAVSLSSRNKEKLWSAAWVAVRNEVICRQATEMTSTEHESFSCPSNNCGECQRESAIEGKS